METDLARVKVALAVTSNAELDALSKATYKVDQIAAGLLAWLDSACVWQLQRRNGYERSNHQKPRSRRRGRYQHGSGGHVARYIRQ